jgi:hypothetical protein
MFHQFDHRWAGFNASANSGEDNFCNYALAQKQSPYFESLPRYWVPQQDVILRSARVPASLKRFIKRAQDEIEKKSSHKEVNADLIEKLRLSALKTLITWIAGAIPALTGRDVQQTDIFKTLGLEQNWHAALETSLARFLALPQTCVAAAKMQKETPLLNSDLDCIVQAPKDALHLAQLLVEIKQPRWLIGYRCITSATNERTVIASVFPKVGAANSVSLINFRAIDFLQIPALLACMSSLIYDYITRQKVGGTNLNQFLLQQTPVFPPSAFSKDDLNFINSRVLELTYTSYSMKPWAQDLGYNGAPFVWDKSRRAQLRAELDAFYAKKYGLMEDELKYILDPAKVRGADYPSETFRILKEKEIEEFGEYQTERLVLDAWKKMGY